MSALGQERSFRPGRVDGCFAPIAVILDHPIHHPWAVDGLSVSGRAEFRSWNIADIVKLIEEWEASCA